MSQTKSNTAKNPCTQEPMQREHDQSHSAEWQWKSSLTRKDNRCGTASLRPPGQSPSLPRQRQSTHAKWGNRRNTFTLWRFRTITLSAVASGFEFLDFYIITRGKGCARASRTCPSFSVFRCSLNTTFRLSLQHYGHRDFDRGWYQHRRFCRHALLIPWNMFNVTLHETGKRCRGIRWLLHRWNMAGTTLPRNKKVRRQHRGCSRLGARKSPPCNLRIRFENCVVIKNHLFTQRVSSTPTMMMFSSGSSHVSSW